MRMYDLIHKKREGFRLTQAEITYIVTGYTQGEIPDYQMSALLMAIYFQGLDEEETVALTLAMAASGRQVDLSAFGSKTADKHSTGGVGDKTTLVAAPIAAACGAVVAKMSGRGLGHTGGTVDKLESIPGFRTELSETEFLNAVRQTGLAVVGQSGNLAPADKKIYALRDVTATVENPALIASSIMSKKLAAGAQNIILDVKYGDGAFMKTPEDAASLARAMVSIGNNAGRRTAAVLTNMQRPLGNAIGNAVEVKEAVETLQGKGPADLTEVSLTLAAKMIAFATGRQQADAMECAREAISSGKALAKLAEMVAAQGGDPAFIHNPALLPVSPHRTQVCAEADGYVSAVQAEQIGLACVRLGAGRSRKEDSIDYGAGIILHKKPGSPVRAGDVMATLYTSQTDAGEAVDMVKSSFMITGTAPEQEKLIYGVIE